MKVLTSNITVAHTPITSSAMYFWVRNVILFSALATRIQSKRSLVGVNLEKDSTKKISRDKFCIASC